MVWLGSIAWDGDPSGIPECILQATTEQEYATLAAGFIAGRDDGTLPDQGWPWPWPDSATTDYAYTWADRVLVSNFGSPWALVTNEGEGFGVSAAFPNMSERMNIAWDERSGLIVIRTTPEEP
jgi:hypothetical protein